MARDYFKQDDLSEKPPKQNSNNRKITSTHERFKYLKKSTDDELISRFNKEVGNSGWVSARGFFLNELRMEFDKRNWDWNIIRNESGGFNLGLGNKVYLKNNKLFLIEDQ